MARKPRPAPRAAGDDAGPTPETAAKLRRDIVARLSQEGRLGREQVRAALETVNRVTGNTDAGAPIEGDVQTAFNAFGRHGALKRCVCLRPVLRGRSEARIGLGALADFRSGEAAPVAAGFGPTTPGWDAAGSAWEDWGDLPWEGGRDSTVAEWRAADGLGYTLAARMTSSTTDDLEWETLTYQIETGRGLI